MMQKAGKISGDKYKKNIHNTSEISSDSEPVGDGDIFVSHCIDTKKDLLCIKYTPCWEYLAAGFTDGQLGLFNMHVSERMFLVDEDIKTNSSPITSIKHGNRPQIPGLPQTITAIHVDGRVKCWDYKNNNCIYTINENRYTLGMAFNPFLPKFLTVGGDGKINLYDEETRTLESVFQASERVDHMDGHMSRIYSACFHPKVHFEFITGGWDSTVQFWDMRQPCSVRHFFGAHICGDGLDICHTGNEILTCSWQKTSSLQLWDYGSSKLIATLQPDMHYPMVINEPALGIINIYSETTSKQLYCGLWITRDLLACGGSEPNMMRVVDVSSLMTVASVSNFSRGVYSLDFGEVRHKRARTTRKYTSSKGPPVSEEGYPLRVGLCAGKKILECDLT